MNIGTAFSKAWSDLKAAAVKAEDFVAQNAPGIESATATVSTIVETVDPASKPAVTAFDDLETLVLGHVTASMASNTKATPPKVGSTFTVTLPAELYPALSSIAQMLSTAVVAAQK